MIWQKFFAIYYITYQLYWLLEPTNHLYHYELHFSIPINYEAKIFCKERRNLSYDWAQWCDAPPPSSMRCQSWHDRERNWRAKWVLPSRATFPGYFFSWLTWPGMQGISQRGEYQPQPELQCLQDFKNVRHSLIIVNWCLATAGDPSQHCPSPRPTRGSCLSDLQYQQPH